MGEEWCPKCPGGHATKTAEQRTLDFVKRLIQFRLAVANVAAPFILAILRGGLCGAPIRRRNGKTVFCTEPARHSYWHVLTRGGFMWAPGVTEESDP